MSGHDRQKTFPGSIMVPTAPTSPPRRSPTQPRSPVSPTSARWGDNVHSTSPVSPTYTLFPTSNNPRSRSPSSLTAPAPAILHNQPATSHSRHTSVQSIAKMPPIREDSSSIITDPGRRRSRSSFYQYGEDYITSWDRAGLTPSPTLRPGSWASSQSARSARSAAGTGVASSLGSGHSTHSVSAPARGGRDVGRTKHLEREREMWREREQDLERGSEGGESEPEKDLGKEVLIRKTWWRRWRRRIVVMLVVVALIGLGVGLAFGLRGR